VAQLAPRAWPQRSSPTGNWRRSDHPDSHKWVQNVGKGRFVARNVSPTHATDPHLTCRLFLLHRHALSSTRAPHPLLCLRPRVASAPFFPRPPPPFFAPARRIRPFLCPPPSPPPRTMKVALHPRPFYCSMCSTCFPVPPPSPSRGVHSSLFHFLRHLPSSAVDLPLRVAAHRVLFLFALLTIALY